MANPWTTNVGYRTTNADAGVGIGMKRGIRKFGPLIGFGARARAWGTQGKFFLGHEP